MKKPANIGHDKRVHPRYPCNIPVKIMTENGEFDGMAVNISLGGIQLESSQFVGANYAVKLRFRLPFAASDTEIPASARYNVGNVFGMQFSSPLPVSDVELNRLFNHGE